MVITCEDTVGFSSLPEIRQKTPDTIVWGFDSFTGLPSDCGGYVITKETFDLGGKLPSVESNVRLVKGYFDQSIDEWLAAEVKGPATISLLHVDSDLYESCQILLEKLNQYIVAGTVVLFDEYFNYPNWQSHSHRSPIALRVCHRTAVAM